MTKRGTCAEAGCAKPVRTRGFCGYHYDKRVAAGLIQTRSKNPDERFWTHVDKSGTCWLWTGSTSNGYGYVRRNKVLLPAHRIAYELLVGPIPDGLELDHLCRVRGCVNPDHLEAVTGRVNNMRSTSATAENQRKTHCTNGHEFTSENIYWTKAGHRACRSCNRDRAKANYWKSKTAST